MADGQGVQSVVENQLFPMQHTWSGVVVGGWGMQEKQNRRRRRKKEKTFLALEQCPPWLENTFHRCIKITERGIKDF